MYPYAQVGTHHKHRYIKPQPQACACCQLLEKSLPTQQAARTLRIFTEQPHIARIKKQCPLQRPHYRKPVLCIKLKLKRARLVEITIDIAL